MFLYRPNPEGQIRAQLWKSIQNVAYCFNVLKDLSYFACGIMCMFGNTDWGLRTQLRTILGNNLLYTCFMLNQEETCKIDQLIQTRLSFNDIVSASMPVWEQPISVHCHLIDHLRNRLNFDLNKSRQKFHHSLKEHHKISNIPKFRCEML
jgi:hypothetical protein